MKQKQIDFTGKDGGPTMVGGTVYQSNDSFMWGLSTILLLMGIFFLIGGSYISIPLTMLSVFFIAILVLKRK